MRMSVTLDDKLVEQVMETFNTTTKREAIERALREAIRSVNRKRAIENRGSIELDITHEDLENLRNTP
jgi:Arc/MetJ family transcription regulator